MTRWKTVALALLIVIGVASAAIAPIAGDGRSVRVIDRANPAMAEGFEREQSTGLFVGVRRFSSDTPDVRYAVDDAVDLAHMFALNGRVSLVPARRMVLVLSGEPVKEESRSRLQKLIAAGARVRRQAGPNEILRLVKEQAAHAQQKGLFVLSLATHGFLDEGVPYILGDSSVIGDPDTALSASKIFDIAGTARRSLVFVDACRDRPPVGTRGSSNDASAAAPLVKKMAKVHGQVIFYAAAPGQYAYDDDVNQNGVFTKAVLDGLACHASATRGAITVDKLRTYVEEHVLAWIRLNRDGTARVATQLSTDGDSKNMPLSNCALPPHGPARVTVDGSTVRVVDDQGTELWEQTFGPVVDALVADLDSDGWNEVLVGVQGRGILTLDASGTTLRTISEAMTLQGFTTADLLTGTRRQVIALWADEASGTSRVTVHRDGELFDTRDLRAFVRHLLVEQPTPRHDPKIVVAGGARLWVLKPRGKPIWSRILEPASATITSLGAFHRTEKDRDIRVTTPSGSLLVDFDGKMRDGGDARVTLRDAPKR